MPVGFDVGEGGEDDEALQVFLFVCTLPQERLRPMPLEGCGVREEAGVVGQGKLVAVQVIVRAAVCEIVAETMADDEPQVFVDRYVAVIEEAMKIRACIRSAELGHPTALS